MEVKKIIIVTVAILYGLLSFLLFSETLLIQLIEAKKEYYLSESQNFYQFNFSKQGWERMEDKKEFIHKGDYYDVKKVCILKDNVKVTVLKDDYENLLKFVAKNISPKNKKHKASKLKRVFEVYIPKTAVATPKEIPANIEHNYYYISSDITSHLPGIFRPPCIS